MDAEARYHLFSEEDTGEREGYRETRNNSGSDHQLYSINDGGRATSPEYGPDGEPLQRPTSARVFAQQEKWQAMYQEAAVYLLEGLYNDKLDSHPNQPDDLRAYHFAHSTPFHVLDLVAGVLLMLLAALEDPGVAGISIPYRAYTAVELCLLLFLSFNVFLRVRWIKVRNLRRHPRIIIKIVIIFVMVIDGLVVFGQNFNHIRVVRALRPFIVLDSYYFKGVRRVARQIIQAIPAVMYMVVLILFVMVLFSAFASMVVAHDHDDPFLHSFTACFYSLFVLMTTANFPDVMMPSYNNQSWSVLFFIVYVCVMVFILLNLLLAVVFSSFQDLEKTKFRKLLIHKRKVIMLMYDLITRATGEDGITFEHFSGIMKYYKPRMGRRDLRCVYLYLARGNSDRLSRSDCYRIYEVTELKWIQVDRLFNQVPWYSNFPACLFQLFRGPDAFVRSKLFSFLSYFLLLCSFVAMIYIAVWNDYGRVDYVVLVSVFVTLCGLEVLLKLLSAGPIRYFLLFWNMWDMALLVLSLVGFGTGIYALQVLVFMRSFRLLKIFQLKQRYRDVISTVVGLVPQMGNVVMVIILLYYFFAIIGIEAFSGKVFPGCCQSPEFMVATYYKKGNVSNETGFYFLNNFDSILQSYVTLFELMVINNWWIVMNGFVSETSGWVRVFFFVYYFLSLMVLNILVSFILDAFVFHLALSPNGEGREEITSSKKGSKYYHTVRIKVGYNEISDDLSQATFFMFPAEGYLLFQGQRRLTREDFSIQMYSGEVETWLEELELEFRNVEADLGSSARHMMHNRRKYNTIRSDITRNLLVVRRYVEDIIRSPEEGDNDGDGFLIINLDEVAPSENGSASSNGAATAGPVRLPAVDQDAAAAAD